MVEASVRRKATFASHGDHPERARVRLQGITRAEDRLVCRHDVVHVRIGHRDQHVVWPITRGRSAVAVFHHFHNVDHYCGLFLLDRQTMIWITRQSY